VRFETTQWSLVLAAGGDDSVAARTAFGRLYETYWYPVYAYVRRRGRDADAARDLTQAVFASLYERRDFEHLDRARGRFRSFLLAATQHYLANDAAYRHAAKRGGGVAPLPLESDRAEERYRHEPADRQTPETLFDRRWALTVIERTMATLREDYGRAGRAALFDALQSSLLGETTEGGYQAIATATGQTAGAVKTSAHRLRRRFQDELRRQIEATVHDLDDVDDEIRSLIRAIAD
jgi:RNA polymerase sigma-70 factor (ECF subfamily)